MSSEYCRECSTFPCACDGHMLWERTVLPIEFNSIIAGNEWHVDYSPYAKGDRVRLTDGSRTVMTRIVYWRRGVIRVQQEKP